MPKFLGDTYLYKKYDKYEQEIFKFIMEAEIIDTSLDYFEDVMIDIKRRKISDSLTELVKKKSVCLMIGNKPLPSPLKVFIAKDIRNHTNQRLLYIDCTNLLINNTGTYQCDSPDILIAHLVNAQTQLIYYTDSKRLLMNSNVIKETTTCFSTLFTHIIDYIGKISTVPSVRNKCLYLTSMYCLVHLLEREDDNSATRAYARSIAGISEREEEMIRAQLPADSYDGLPQIIDTIGEVLNIRDKISIDLICEKWMYIYGTGTIFGLELFTSFAAMITNAYTGCYLNNQVTIEKLTGNHMVLLTKKLLEIGGDSI